MDANPVDPQKKAASAGCFRYAAAVFLGAFLLFQVQPLLAKAILPWFGGAAAVWTVCMLFFQVLLLGGYLYAHFISTRLAPRAQALLHLSLLAASLVFLNILPSDAWRPAGGEAPALLIMALLAVNIGVPYFVLSATSPLMQAWSRSAVEGREPYRLYALSNAGSLLALLSYPFLFEPFLALKTQAAWWAALYAVFAAFCGWCAVPFLRSEGAVGGGVPEKAPEAAARPGWPRRALWVVLSACGSALLLATTNQLTQDLPPVPFLWLLPLGLYLLSFILCFDSPRWYSRPTWTVFLVLACAGVCYALYKGIYVPLPLQLLIYPLTLFIACMVCHGELARHKPAAEFLTGFYALVSAGGALGGALVAVAAPLLLNGPWEYHLAWLLLFAVMLAILAREEEIFRLSAKRAPAAVLLVAAFTAFGWLLYANYEEETDSMLDMERNFYGTLRIYDSEFSGGRILTLMHGQIDHGFQFYPGDPRRRRPVSYYGPGTGAGVSMLAMRRIAAAERRTLNVGLVGLGAGIMAAWGRPGDRLTFYEINPLVVRLSGEYFSYVRDSPSEINVVMGDARLSLEREADPPRSLGLDRSAAGRPAARAEPLDLLVLDAFSGDSIPLHLLTREAFKIYFGRLRPGGALAVHVSNQFIDLAPLMRGLAKDCGKYAVAVESSKDEKTGVEDSTWVLLTDNRKFLADPLVRNSAVPWPKNSRPVVFTDQYSNLFSLLDLKNVFKWL